MQKKNKYHREVPRRLHFIGIAGAGMSALAFYLLAAGYDVRGSDCRLSPVLEDLAAKGAVIYTCQEASHLKDADWVIYSSAVPADNPERVEARRRGIEEVQRGALLAYLSNAHPHSIAVCGTHGKGTTAGAILAMVEAAKWRCSYILGAPVLGQTSASHYESDSEVFIVEVDESDRTHLFHRPSILLLNNVEVDHLNEYKDLDDIVESFKTLIVDCLNSDCQVVFQVDGIGSPPLAESLKPHSHLYFALWEPDSAKINTRDSSLFWTQTINRGDTGNYRFYVQSGGMEALLLAPRLGGLANAHNIFSAACVAKRLGLSDDAIREGSETYEGLNDRCQTWLNEDKDIELVTDYASHPTSIRYDIAWKRSGNRQIIAVFQPYRYSLMSHHWEALIESLATADCVMLAPLDPCGEIANEGISSLHMARGIEELGTKASAFDSLEELELAISESLTAQDCLMVFGGGAIFDMGRRLVLS